MNNYQCWFWKMLKYIISDIHDIHWFLHKRTSTNYNTRKRSKISIGNR